MQNAGYNTYYSGKLWNAHSVDNYNAPSAGGYNGSDFILDPYTYEYYNAHMSRNGGKPVSYKGQYSPDITAEKAYGFLEEATQHPEPWFLTIAPIAPHSMVKLEPADEYNADLPQYAERHAHLFKGYKIPRDANFNPEHQGGTGWIKSLPRLNATIIDYNDRFQRSRLRALQSVDEMIEQLIKTLEAKNLLDDTYIFYTTDNGYHLSQHRLHPGKECGYDTDIHIPLIVRGPGVHKGHTTHLVSSHTDIAPTILALANHSRTDFDGSPIPLSHTDTLTSSRTEHINIEYWGRAIPEGRYGAYHDSDNAHPTPGQDWGGYLVSIRNNTYKGLRVISEEYSLYYSVWCTGDSEFYDVRRDPGQMENYFDERYEGADIAALRKSFSIAGRAFERVVDRLDALMMVLKSCKGESCREPWRVLHSGSGSVRTLRDALDERFDAFYEGQPKVRFEECALGYVREVEGPQGVNGWEQWMEGNGEAEAELLELKMRRKPSFVYQGNPHLLT